jgi:hypothetical protein
MFLSGAFSDSGDSGDELRRQKKRGFWPKVTKFFLKIDVLVENAGPCQILVSKTPLFSLRHFAQPRRLTLDDEKVLPNFQVNFDLCVCVSLHENSHCFEW